MEVIKYEKLTNYSFLNLFKATYKDLKGKIRFWFFASRKKDVMNASFKDQQIDAVVVVPFTEDGKIVLSKQFRIAINNYVYEFPAGLIDDNETLLQAAKRELKEETGLIMDGSSYTRSDQLFNSAGITNESCSVIFAKVNGIPSSIENESSEEISIITLNREEIKNLLLNCGSNVFDAKSWLILLTYANGFEWLKI